MKIEPNMYVRTKDDGIQKITKITENNCFYRTCTAGFEYKTSLFENDIIGTPSFDKIDLIRVGDYVNGCYVSNRRASVNEHLGGNPKGIGIIKCNAYFNQGNYDDCKFVWIEEKDIKSIVTKEQFESISYKVGDDK